MSGTSIIAKIFVPLSQWDHLGAVDFRTRAKENGTLCKSQTLFVQMSLSDVESVRARKIMSIQMAVLSLSCFFIIPLSVTPIRILPVNKKQIKTNSNKCKNFHLNTVESR